MTTSFQKEQERKRNAEYDILRKELDKNFIERNYMDLLLEKSDKKGDELIDFLIHFNIKLDVKNEKITKKLHKLQIKNNDIGNEDIERYVKEYENSN